MYRTIAFRDSELMKPTIAVIEIKGEINADQSLEINKLITKAGKDSEVKAIVFEIDSPGGTVVPSEEIAAAIKQVQKPTVAWIREAGASGAYWIASAANKIVCDPASITGSIGVSGSYLQFSGLMDKYGVTYERLVSGTYKDTGSEYKNMTADERKYLQAKIDAINQIFIDAISKNRKMSRDSVAKLATGEIFLGTEAKQLGLVDILGGKAEAQAAAQELANLKESRLVLYEQKSFLWGAGGQQVQSFAYWIGKGLGDSLKPEASSSLELKAELQ